MEKIKLRRKRSLGFATAKKLFAVAKRFTMAKADAYHCKEKVGGKTNLVFTTTKKLFVGTKRFTPVKAVAHHGEEEDN